MKKKWQKKSYHLDLAKQAKNQADQYWEKVFSNLCFTEKIDLDILIGAMDQSNRAEVNLLEIEWEIAAEKSQKEFKQKGKNVLR